MNCIFCEIVSKDPHNQVLKTIKVSGGFEIKVFEPLNPCVNGHLLFVPVIHIDNMLDKNNPLSSIISGATAEAMSIYAKEIGQVFNMISNNGVDAEQTVFHQHFHYIPRHKDDDVKMPWSWQKEKNDKGRL